MILLQQFADYMINENVLCSKPAQNFAKIGQIVPTKTEK